MVRNVIACVLGIVVASGVNMALVTLGPQVIPTPPGVDVTDSESLRASAHLLQPKHFVFPFLAHALGTLAGSLVTFVIATKHKVTLAYAIGALSLAGGIAASVMIPAPKWFIALDLIVAYIPMAWLATRLGSRKGAAHFSS